MDKYRFGILVGFTHIIAYQTRFENSSGNTKYGGPYSEIKLKLFNAFNLDHAVIVASGYQ